MSLSIPLLLIIAVVLPLLLALLAATAWRNSLPLLAILAPLPLLLLLLTEEVVLELPWLLLGMRLGIDTVNLAFILLTATVWLAAAVYARFYFAADSQATRFYVFFLLTLSGNIGVVLALDSISFYLFFTIMSFAAYGLIIHNANAESFRAGKIYLMLAIIGEVLLLGAIIWLTATVGVVDLHELPAMLTADSAANQVLWLVFAGFAIKLGVVPLHIWLPLAHPAAPIPASAILSGVLLKIGLLGWLRFLPFGEQAMPELGQLCLLLGTLSIFYGVAVGVLQKRPKTVLAYSSISQMGLITVLVGAGLLMPQQWPLVFFTLTLFCLHHGLAKAVLFLGIGALTRRSSLWLLILPTLALVGAPLSSGAIAKLAVKETLAEQMLVLPFMESINPIDISTVLVLSSVTTGLLLLRFLYLLWSETSYKTGVTGLVAPCVTLTLVSMTIPWWWAYQYQPALINKAFDSTYIELTFILMLISVIITSAVWLLWRVAGAKPLWQVPEGDIVVLAGGLKLAAVAFRKNLLKLGNWLQIRWISPLFAQSERRLLVISVNNERALLVIILLLFIVFIIR